MKHTAMLRRAIEQSESDLFFEITDQQTEAGWCDEGASAVRLKSFFTADRRLAELES